MDRATAVAALEAQRQATLGLLASLARDEWDLPALPGWRVREVVAHLITVDEADATGRLLRVLRRGGREVVERWNAEAVTQLADADPEELVALLTRWGRRLAVLAGRLPPAVDRVPVRGAFGRQSLRVLVGRRVVDEWVHAVDIARATGRSAAVPPGVAGVLCEAILATLPALLLPRLRGRRGVVRLDVDVPGDAGADETQHRWGVDFARLQYGPRVRTWPDATIRVDVTTLALLTEGRLRWPEVVGRGLLVTGDEAVARQLLDHLDPAASP